MVSLPDNIPEKRRFDFQFQYHLLECRAYFHIFTQHFLPFLHCIEVVLHEFLLRIRLNTQFQHVYSLIKVIRMILDLSQLISYLILLQFRLQLYVLQCNLCQTLNLQDQLLLLQSDLVFSLELVLLQLSLQTLEVSVPVLDLGFVVCQLLDHLINVVDSAFVQQLQVIYEFGIPNVQFIIVIRHLIVCVC